jgi:predicted AAA+ superfamily ATPase
MAKLESWKNSQRRKPLIINGARQVGKTWLLKEFGKTCFDNFAYINFDNNQPMAQLFEADYDLDRLLVGIQAEASQKIDANKTLIVFDEIQECPKALTSLKYFHEKAPELAIAAAGSLLGLAIHQGSGYPVGNVTSLNLYPLSFREFLCAVGHHELHSLLEKADGDTLSTFSAKLTSLLRQYYFVGGMPEAVVAFAENGVLADAREVQNQILLDYRRDIAKHLEAATIERTFAAWNSIPVHLGQENKKFVFGHIKEGARARDYRAAITWLAEAGLAYIVPRVTKPGLPLLAYAEESAFKLYLLDVGLLGAMSGLPANNVLDGSSMFTEFKGALAEQYVCQQLIADCGLEPYYWSADNSQGEIDFLIQNEDKIYSIEVKAEENLKARSLRAFHDRYQDTLARRFSLSGYREEAWMRNTPLYAVGQKRLWE